MIEKTLRIRVLSYQNSDLMMAVSDDLRGLVVHGRSDREIEDLLPVAIRDLLEADGFNVIDLSVARVHESPVAALGPPAFLATASLTGQARVA